MEKKNNSIKYVAIQIIAFVILLPVCYLSFFNFPQSDDWAYAARALKNNFVMANYGYYNYINGRYFATFILMSINPLCYLNFDLFKIIPIIYILLTVFAYKKLLETIFIVNNKISIWSIALFFTSIFMASMPSITEGIYWLSGTATYQTAHILILVLITKFLNIKDELKLKDSIWLSIIYLCILGLNEIASVISIVCLGFYIKFQYKNINKRSLNIYIILLSIVVGLLLMFLSPGNMRRNTLYLNSHNFEFTIYGAISTFASRYAFWILISFITSFLFINYLKLKLRFNIASFPLIIFLILSITLPFVLYLPAFWGLGEAPPLRTENTIYFIFFLINFFLFTITMVKLNQIKDLRINNYISVGFLGLLFIMLFKLGNIQKIYQDVISELPAKYYIENSNRIEKILTNSADTIYLETLTAKPKSLFFDDIGDSSHYWINKSYSQVLNCKPIAISKD